MVCVNTGGGQPEGQAHKGWSAWGWGLGAWVFCCGGGGKRACLQLDCSGGCWAVARAGYAGLNTASASRVFWRRTAADASSTHERRPAGFACSHARSRECMAMHEMWCEASPGLLWLCRRPQASRRDPASAAACRAGRPGPATPAAKGRRTAATTSRSGAGRKGEGGCQAPGATNPAAAGCCVSRPTQMAVWRCQDAWREARRLWHVGGDTQPVECLLACRLAWLPRMQAHGCPVRSDCAL